MTWSTVYKREYNAPEVSIKEILRYARSGEEAKDVVTLAQECLEEAAEVLSYKVCFREFDISVSGDQCDLGFVKVKSKGLSKNLGACKRAIVFAATVGLGIDRLIMKYGAVAPSKTVMFHAIGAERVEALCDLFCTDMENELGPITRRFSPGYGDLSLSMQRDIFRALDCTRQIGLTLNDSLIMSPSKSVTAIFGIKDSGDTEEKEDKCEICSSINCPFRRV